MQGANNTYWGDIVEGIKSIKLGLIISWRHFYLAVFKGKRQKNVDITSKDYFDKAEGVFTVEYPKVSIPVPDNGRYRLHNEIDDCIVCDKCAKICPVDCIDIEAVKSPAEIRKTSDGSSVRLHAAKFDIDMAKCCNCGLCTVVCPTESLTMTKAYDYSEVDISKMVYEFSELSDKEVVEKKKEYDDFQLEKQAKMAAKKETPTETAVKAKVPGVKIPGAKPKIPGAKPKIPGAKPKIAAAIPKIPGTVKSKIPGVAKPKIPGASKPVIPSKEEAAKANSSKPVMKPKMPSKSKEDEKPSPLKPKVKPLKPVIPKPKKKDDE